MRRAAGDVADAPLAPEVAPASLPAEGNIHPVKETNVLRRSLTTIGLILCRIGLHRWGRKRGYDEYSSNVIEWEQRCERCGKRRRWIEVKRDRRR